MTANDSENQVKTEVKKQDVAPVKWNGPRTAEGKQRIAQAQTTLKATLSTPQQGELVSCHWMPT